MEQDPAIATADRQYVCLLNGALAAAKRYGGKPYADGVSDVLELVHTASDRNGTVCHASLYVERLRDYVTNDVTEVDFAVTASHLQKLDRTDLPKNVLEAAALELGCESAAELTDTTCMAARHEYLQCQFDTGNHFCKFEGLNYTVNNIDLAVGEGGEVVLLGDDDQEDEDEADIDTAGAAEIAALDYQFNEITRSLRHAYDARYYARLRRIIAWLVLKKPVDQF